MIIDNIVRPYCIIYGMMNHFVVDFILRAIHSVEYS